jgi:phosphate starvation-inducible PhoH-like protein
VKPARRQVLSLAGVDPVTLVGRNDWNLRFLERHLAGSFVVRGDSVILDGTEEEVAEMSRVFGELISLSRQGVPIGENELSFILGVGNSGASNGSLADLERELILPGPSGKKGVRPHTPNQAAYVETISRNDIVFSIGPAGTGKTYLAIACAVAALKKKEVDRIFLVRPAVEAGESLGFLPGDLQEKINPYLRPLFDALHDMIEVDTIKRHISNGVIEVAPLAYMRGRTLSDAFVVLDEAQNTTVGQMKMFLTRLGFNAKAVITGDVTQIDLERPERSGLLAARRLLRNLEKIGFVYLGEEDVVRHPLVRRIIRAFSEAGEISAETPPGRTDPSVGLPEGPDGPAAESEGRETAPRSVDRDPPPQDEDRA